MKNKKLSIKLHLLFCLVICFIMPSVSKAEALEIITLGDSITAGMIRTSSGVISCPSGVAYSLSVFTTSDRRLVCNGFGAEGVGGYQPTLKSKLKAEGYSVSIYNHGYSGAESSQLTGLINTYLNQRPNSDYILIMSGANDSGDISTSTFIFHIEFMIKASCSKGITPIVGTVTRRYEPSYRNKYVVGFNSAIKEITNPVECSSRGIKLRIADQYEATNSTSNFTDGLHLSTLGNINMANEWFRVITTETKVGFLPAIYLLLSD